MPDSKPSGTLLSKNNLIRSRQNQPAPIRRSDSSRIETWRDEVICCSDFETVAPPEATQKEHGGRLAKVTSKIFRRTSGLTESVNSGKGGERTSMYAGNTGNERVMDEWEEGAGPSMYLGSIGSDDGRLERAEQLLNRGCGDADKVQDQVKGVEQARPQAVA